MQWCFNAYLHHSKNVNTNYNFDLFGYKIAFVCKFVKTFFKLFLALSKGPEHP